MRCRGSGQGRVDIAGGGLWNEIERRTALDFAPAEKSGGFRFLEGGEEPEKRFYPRHDQGITNAFIHAHQRKRATISIVGDISTHQGSDAGRVHVWNAGKIEDEYGGILGAQACLELKERAQHYRAFQA
jgi:hypothetical protein